MLKNENYESPKPSKYEIKNPGTLKETKAT